MPDKIDGAASAFSRQVFNPVVISAKEKFSTLNNSIFRGVSWVTNKCDGIGNVNALTSKNTSLNKQQNEQTEALKIQNDLVTHANKELIKVNYGLNKQLMSEKGISEKIAKELAVVREIIAMLEKAIAEKDEKSMRENIKDANQSKLISAIFELLKKLQAEIIKLRKENKETEELLSIFMPSSAKQELLKLIGSGVPPEKVTSAFSKFIKVLTPDKFEAVCNYLRKKFNK